MMIWQVPAPAPDNISRVSVNLLLNVKQNLNVIKICNHIQKCKLILTFLSHTLLLLFALQFLLAIPLSLLKTCFFSLGLAHWERFKMVHPTSCPSGTVYMRDTLHGLPDVQRISCRIAVLVWQCLLCSAPTHL